MDGKGVQPQSLQNLIRQGEPLEPGEQTAALRVRAPVTVMTWAASLTPAQRGRILAAAFEQQDTNE